MDDFVLNFTNISDLNPRLVSAIDALLANRALSASNPVLSKEDVDAALDRIDKLEATLGELRDRLTTIEDEPIPFEDVADNSVVDDTQVELITSSAVVTRSVSFANYDGAGIYELNVYAYKDRDITVFERVLYLSASGLEDYYQRGMSSPRNYSLDSVVVIDGKVVVTVTGGDDDVRWLISLNKM